MSPRARLALILATLLAGVALGASTDGRGWKQGTPAAGAPQILTAPESVALELPAFASREVDGPTLLVYFSPGCPHCRNVAPELAALAARLEGKAKLLGVATGSAEEIDVEAFRKAFGWSFPVLRDKDHTIASALGARGTPAAVLVVPQGKDRVAVVDRWYPYAPGTDALVELRVAGDPWKLFEPGRYLGNRACGACHTQELEAWLLSHHSVAWRTLVKGGEHENAGCVGCHVTGHGQPGGWSGENASTLVDVGCEACHGPGGPHDGQPTDAASTCVGCHDAEHSIAFSPKKGLPLIDHFRTVDMSDDQLYEARKALLDGEAPRELLAFAEGTTVGSAACATCHAAEHGHWQRSPHAAAMGSLTAQGAPAQEVSCVRCHAGQKVSGPPPSELSGYRVDEGVGCESCHGPGEAHVKAGGGKGNIVGLGESCPVCVIEAVCTSCHTKQWDPTWQLDADLPKVGHGKE